MYIIHIYIPANNGAYLYTFYSLSPPPTLFISLLSPLLFVPCFPPLPPSPTLLSPPSPVFVVLSLCLSLSLHSPFSGPRFLLLVLHTQPAMIYTMHTCTYVQCICMPWDWVLWCILGLLMCHAVLSMRINDMNLPWGNFLTIVMHTFLDSGSKVNVLIIMLCGCARAPSNIW